MTIDTPSAEPTTSPRLTGTFFKVTEAYGFFKAVTDGEGKKHPDVFLRVSELNRSEFDSLDDINGHVCAFLTRPSDHPKYLGKVEAWNVCDTKTPYHML